MNPLTKLAAHLVSTILLAVGLVACDSARHPPRDCAAASTLRNVRETMSGEKPSIRLIKFSNSLLKIDERYILFPITYDNGSYQQAASSRPKTHLNVRAISLRMSLPDLAPPSQADEEARFQESKEIAGSPSCWMTVGIEQWGNGTLAIQREFNAKASRFGVLQEGLSPVLAHEKLGLRSVVLMPEQRRLNGFSEFFWSSQTSPPDVILFCTDSQSRWNDRHVGLCTQKFALPDSHFLITASYSKDQLRNWREIRSQLIKFINGSSTKE